MAATTLAIMNVAQAGDHVVSSSNVYGGTFNLFNYTLPKFGIEVTFVNDTGNMDAWRAAVKPNTKAFFGEGISNPLGAVLDLEAIAQVAHEAGVPWIVDNTIATPYVTRHLIMGSTSSLTQLLSSYQVMAMQWLGPLLTPETLILLRILKNSQALMNLIQVITTLSMQKPLALVEILVQTLPTFSKLDYNFFETLVLQSHHLMHGYWPKV